MSDDGEPRGTAGKPILSVLLHSEIGEIVAVVTRYFGGTKLGTGGLLRAYAGAVKNALSHLPVKEKRDVVLIKITLDYSKLTAAKRMIQSFNGAIIKENYTANVTLKIEIPTINEGRFIRSITDLAGGEIVIAN